MTQEQVIVFEKEVNFQDVVHFVLVANHYENEIKLRHRGTEINGKGVVGLMKLMHQIEQGEPVTITVGGHNSEQVLSELLLTVDSKQTVS